MQLNQIARIRQFAETRWPFGSPSEQCDLTALLAMRILGGGVLQGGHGWAKGSRLPAGGGFRTASGDWELHYWTEIQRLDGPWILDFTSDQFGGPKIFLTPAPHRNYLPNFAADHLETVTATNRPVVDEWHRQWLISQKPQSLLTGKLQLVLTRNGNPFKVLPLFMPLGNAEALLARLRRSESQPGTLTWHAVECVGSGM